METESRRLRVAKSILAISYRSWANWLTPIAKDELQKVIPNHNTMTAQEAYDAIKEIALSPNNPWQHHQIEHLMLAVAVANRAAKEAAQIQHQGREQQLSGETQTQTGGRNVQSIKKGPQEDGDPGEEEG